jgi:hypothetical protein
MCTASKDLHCYSERYAISERMYLGVLEHLFMVFLGPLYTQRGSGIDLLFGVSFSKTSEFSQKDVLTLLITTFHLHQKHRFGCKNKHILVTYFL